MLRRLLQRSLAIGRKEVLHILRDPQVLLFALGMPLVLIFLFGYAVTFDIEQIPLVLVDQEQSPATRRLERYGLHHRVSIHAPRAGGDISIGIA